MNQAVRDSTEQHLRKLGEDWAAAEQHGDTTALGHLLTADFVGVGPRGFLLPRAEWLQRHASGDLKYTALRLEDVTVRVYGDAAIMLGRQVQKAAYQRREVPGEFRVTLVWIQQQGDWRLAGLQLSPIAGPP